MGWCKEWIENSTPVNLCSQLGRNQNLFLYSGNELFEEEADYSNTKTKLWFSFKCLLQKLSCCC